MAVEDYKKTDFVTRYGLYEYSVLPLGLCNAPSTFYYLMNEVMLGYVDDHVDVYLDDTLVHCKTESEHELYLSKVFEHLR